MVKNESIDLEFGQFEVFLWTTVYMVSNGCVFDVGISS